MTEQLRAPVRVGSQDEPATMLLTGVQAMVQVIVDQLQRDVDAGLNTAGFVSGYPGSPLAGFDQELVRRRATMQALRVTHLPGHNEELAATAVWGSQLAQTLPDALYDGVLGAWYGKGPGLDRSVDAIRHAQFIGTARRGGVLAFVGDDPSCKSSSIPYSTEHTLHDLGLPILAPADVADVLELGVYGAALSRLCGLWTALRVVTSVADGVATVPASRTLPEIASPEISWRGRPFTPTLRGSPGPVDSIEVEAEIRGPRTELARLFGYENRLNRVRHQSGTAWLSLVAVGHLYGETMSALRALGLQPDDLPKLGVRVCQVRMQHPLDTRTIAEFADGVERVVVIEEKRAFVEAAVRQLLYETPARPRVVGKLDEHGEDLLPTAGAVTADLIADVLFGQLSTRLPAERLLAPRRTREQLTVLPAVRTPYFCSGCPHNSSTRVPEGALVGGGIGCHSLTLFMDPKVVGDIASTTHMGGEGAQWLGAAPFVRTGHTFQNMGDGTYFHSGQLAVQAAVAAKANITYKLLYNDAIAMTGGQPTAESNSRPIADVAEILVRQGVARVLITTEDTSRYGHVRLPRGTHVWDRSRIIEAQEALRATPGVTVLIHDQRCAAENRRDRKRGRADDPPARLFINQRICEGCGDCGAKSNCLSVEPVDTEFGRKTQINQDSCNKDYSCLAGDCPSFITVIPRRARHRRSRRRAGVETTAAGPATPVLAELPEPVLRIATDDVTIRMPGIGGTGVVTASRILATAAGYDGRFVTGMDQTGLSQKAGPVVSELHISVFPVEGSNTSTASSADVMIGFDLLGAATAATQRTLAPGRTVAVISSSKVPTGAMVSDVGVDFPDVDELRAKLAEQLGDDQLHWVDAQRVTTELLGEATAANIFLLGVAFQVGALPVTAASLERAIVDNVVAADANLAAFRCGRRWAVGGSKPARPIISSGDAPQSQGTPEWFTDLVLPEQLRDLAESRAADLVGYQSRRYAAGYAAQVTAIAAAESRVKPASTVLTEAVVRNLHKLMAYKDEYEVARLSLDRQVRGELDAIFGPDVKTYWNLHPPALRALGVKHKLRLGRWFTPAYVVLHRTRRLRGTALDPFGHSRVRRLERALIKDFAAALDQIAAQLTVENLALAVRIAGLPETVRGYEQLKLDSGARFRAELSALVAQFPADISIPSAPRPA